jgi:hypothetical protein
MRKLKAKKGEGGKGEVKGERVIVDRVCLAGRGEQTEVWMGRKGGGWRSNQRKNNFSTRKSTFSYKIVCQGTS